MSESLPVGSLLLIAPKRTFFSFGSAGAKSLEKRLQGIARASSLGKNAANQQGLPLATYSLGAGAALVVRPALAATAFAQRAEPAVHYDPSRQLVCAFFGHLENLGELAVRYDCASSNFEGGPPSPTSVLGDPAQLAAATIAAMYLRERSGDLTVLLSELQGSYTFVLFDGGNRAVFAARDSRADSSPLFYELADDGALTLSNTRLAVPADVGLTHWSELPPGHLISGRGSRAVAQFALTPEQLSWRESYEFSLEEELSLSSPRATGGSSRRSGSWGEREPSRHSTLDAHDDGLVLGPAECI